MSARGGNHSLEDRLVRLLRPGAGFTASELGEVLSRRAGAIGAALRRMERAGRVAATGEGRGKVWKLSDEARRK